MDFGVENRPKINQKSIENDLENKIQVGLHVWWLLDRIWLDFGAMLGPKLAPSWAQVGTKSLQKSIQKVIKKMITFWIALESDLKGLKY